jgi:hypothetical protein
MLAGLRLRIDSLCRIGSGGCSRQIWLLWLLHARHSHDRRLCRSGPGPQLLTQEFATGKLLLRRDRAKEALETIKGFPRRAWKAKLLCEFRAEHGALLDDAEKLAQLLVGGLMVSQEVVKIILL